MWYSGVNNFVLLKKLLSFIYTRVVLKTYEFFLWGTLAYYSIYGENIMLKILFEYNNIYWWHRSVKIWTLVIQVLPGISCIRCSKQGFHSAQPTHCSLFWVRVDFWESGKAILYAATVWIKNWSWSFCFVKSLLYPRYQHPGQT